MNFKMFMYYCAICGGWAALITWAIQQFTIKRWGVTNVYVESMIIAALLGLLLAFVIGLLDALLNSVGFARVMRVMICIVVGLIGSLICGLIGEGIHQATISMVGGEGIRCIGWMLVGGIIGASIGVWDVIRAMGAGKGMKQAIRKIINGILGGTIGGFIGGLLLDFSSFIPLGYTDEAGIVYEKLRDYLPKSFLATGLVILGMCIGLLIGVAQVVLKEAWVRIEKGFRAGREMILTKPEVLIGRAEGVDIALFGDMQCEKQHARITLKGDRYVLIDLDTPGGTTVNGQRISGPYPLSNGDVIGCGNSKVRFNERSRR